MAIHKSGYADIALVGIIGMGERRLKRIESTTLGRDCGFDENNTKIPRNDVL
jgi:hypothetical protein